MRQRNCAGGVVFVGEKVLLLQNDKGDWLLPKGAIHNGEHPGDVARKRVRQEAGVEAEIIGQAGETCYEFFSMSRRAPICNKIDWFIMQAGGEDHQVSNEEGFQDGGFFPADEAMKKITYSQDKALIHLALEKYRAFQMQA